MNGETPSYVLSNRLKTAHAYLTAHPEAIAVLSGGQGPGEDITEAEAMRRYLADRGIDEGRLLLEERSTSTEENIRFSLALLRERTGAEPSRLCIVSTGFHLYRACLLARQSVPDAFGVAAELPYAAFFAPNYYLREYFAVLRTYISLLFGN